MSDKMSTPSPTECYTRILPNGRKITWFNEPMDDKWVGKGTENIEKNKRKT
jgi:hypothetical protein